MRIGNQDIADNLEKQPAFGHTKVKTSIQSGGWIEGKVLLQGFTFGKKKRIEK